MRLLAIAADPSLEVALTMMDDWDVLSVPDVRAAAERANGIDALVIGVGTTEDGLAHAQTARDEGVTLPLIVVGDAPGPEDADAIVVERPFSLDDIRAAVKDALERPVRAPEPDPEPPADDVVEVTEEPAYEPELVEEPRAPTILGVVPDEDELEGIDLAEVSVPGTASEPEPVPERPSLRVAPPPREAPEVERHSVGPPQPEQPRTDPRATPPAERTPTRTHGAGAPAAARVPEPEPDPEPEESPVRREPAASVAAPPARPEPPVPVPPRAEPPVQPARPQPPAPVQPLPTAPSPRTSPQPAAFEAEPARKSRRFGRRRQVEARPDESPLERRLRAAARGVLEIEGLLHELPMVGDLNALCIALTGEVVELVKPETAAVYVRRGGKFVIEAWHGLSKSERSMDAKPEHPLFVELADPAEAMLIEPVELAQGLVAGIAGTHTRALIAAPVTVEGTAFAYIVLGRDGFSDADLDAIDNLAREAAPGLAVAQMLERLARKRG